MRPQTASMQRLPRKSPGAHCQKSQGAALTAKMASLQIVIDGCRQIISTNQPEIEKLGGELTRRVHAENVAQLRADLAALETHGQELVERIVSALSDLMLVQIPELDRARVRLVQEFLDLHGQAASEKLGRRFDEAIAQRTKGLHVYNQGVAVEVRSLVPPGT